ncbi:TPA_asm: coat protein [ssRNA phage ESO001]|uniref:Coat protein n=1 Tax=ssRNA phage ESO001 TaxID=2786008 RepID=A0A8S5KXI6_9VIRU|nr:coat protein [ssRNA phage ESO001]DAD49920.1 TPA_asm: coat protein [ssRNA phage ESO001]
MTSDLTIDTLSFKLQFGDESGSLRRDVSRGVNLPTEMRVSHQDYVDSKTKVSGKRHLVRFDRFVAFSSGIIAPVSAYAVVTVPGDVNVVSADVLAVVQHLNNALFASTQTSGLDLKDEIFVNQEQ